MSRTARLNALLPILLVSMMLTCVITAWVTWLNIGPDVPFMPHWVRAALIAWVVMLPLGGVVMAGATRLVAATLSQRTRWVQRLALALVMGLSMEAIVSALATITNVGLNAHTPGAWVHAYVRALPLGLVIGLLMGFVVKPWVDARLARAAALA